MSIDFSKPVKTDNYDTGFLSAVREHVAALAMWLDSTNSVITGTPPAYAKRYNRSTKYIEEFNGTSWTTLPVNVSAVVVDATQQITAQGSQSSAIGTSTTYLGGVRVVGGGGETAAFMCFHRPSSYAAYFGLDTDNVWKVGGWSMGAVAYALLHAGNFNSWAPTLTGGGASGSWAINAATASTLQSAILTYSSANPLQAYHGRLTSLASAFTWSTTVPPGTVVTFVNLTGSSISTALIDAIALKPGNGSSVFSTGGTAGQSLLILPNSRVKLTWLTSSLVVYDADYGCGIVGGSA